MSEQARQEVKEITEDVSPRKKRLGRIVGPLAVGTLAGLTIFALLEMASDKTEYTAVAGRVTCPAGQAVTGVWVQPYQGEGRGWARWMANPGQPNVATYNKVIEDSAPSYQVSVGCDGTPSNWAHDYKSQYIPNMTVLFSVVCNDLPDVKIDTCMVAPLG
jgi:hypothetical protein